MRVADLSPERRAWLRACCYDRFVEKHEGPWDWDWLIDGPHADYRADFLTIDGRDVLLPVPVEHHPHISLLRGIVGVGGDTLTLFLKDTTFAEHYGPDGEWFWAGFLAVCDRAPGADWYVATQYHEIYLAGDATPLHLPPWPDRAR